MRVPSRVSRPASSHSNPRYFLRAFGWTCCLVIVSLLIPPSSLAQPADRERASKLVQDAQQAVAQRDYERAIGHYQELVGLGIRSVGLFLQLGLAQYQNGDYSAAASSLREVLKLEPELPAAEAFLGLSEAALRNMDSGLPLLEKAFRSNDPEIDQELKLLIGTHLGKAYSKTGRLTDAEAVYLALLKEHPNNTDLLYHAFWLHLGRAREIMKQLTLTAPDSSRTHQMLGKLVSQRRNYSGAVEQFRLALKADPTALELHYELGNALLLLGGPNAPEEAKKEYQEELRLNPGHAGSYYQLAELELQSQQLEKAEKLYARVLELEPQFGSALVGLCKISIRKDSLKEAAEYCEKAAAVEPDNQQAHYLLSRAYQGLGRAAEARAQLELFEKLQSQAKKETDYIRQAKIGVLPDH